MCLDVPEVLGSQVCYKTTKEEECILTTHKAHEEMIVTG